MELLHTRIRAHARVHPERTAIIWYGHQISRDGWVSLPLTASAKGIRGELRKVLE